MVHLQLEQRPLNGIQDHQVFVARDRNTWGIVTMRVAIGHA